MNGTPEIKQRSLWSLFLHREMISRDYETTSNNVFRVVNLSVCTPWVCVCV